MQSQGALAAWKEAFAKQGAMAARDVTGSFAVGLRDATGRVFLAVDRFAVDTMCYRIVDSKIAFASRADDLASADTPIDPQAIFQATKRGRDLQLEIVGFFHSHPDYPAVPSLCDRDLAWDVYSYPIVSVMQGKVNDFKSWVLDELGIFQQEEIQ